MLAYLFLHVPSVLKEQSKSHCQVACCWFGKLPQEFQLLLNEPGTIVNLKRALEKQLTVNKKQRGLQLASMQNRMLPKRLVSNKLSKQAF